MSDRCESCGMRHAEAIVEGEALCGPCAEAAWEEIRGNEEDA